MTDSAETMRKADRTRIFFDTEFIEDGKTIDLISIGMVRDDGETYYAESSDCDLSRADQWVKDNVLIHLRGGSAIKSRRQIAADIIAFAGPSPEFWAYYADYDWVVLCQLYGRMIDLPNGWPMFCRDLKQLAGDTVLPQQISTEHHALADAKWAAEAIAAWNARPGGDEAVRTAEDRGYKRAVKMVAALIADAMVYSDSYGVQGSDFLCCMACNAGGAPGVPFEHSEDCIVLKCETIADDFWQEQRDELTALSAGETKEDDRPLSDAEIRAGINILLETIAKKFEAYDTLDIWRSDAADIVRSYKHSFSGETKSDGGAEVASSAAPATRGEQRDRTHGTMPVGSNAENSARTDRSPSDPIPSQPDEREAIAEAIWRAEYRRATGRERSIPWSEVSNNDHERYCYIARAILAMQAERRGAKS